MTHGKDDTAEDIALDIALTRLDDMIRRNEREGKTTDHTLFGALLGTDMVLLALVHTLAARPDFGEQFAIDLLARLGILGGSIAPKIARRNPRRL